MIIGRIWMLMHSTKNLYLHLPQILKGLQMGKQKIRDSEDILRYRWQM